MIGNTPVSVLQGKTDSLNDNMDGMCTFMTLLRETEHIQIGGWEKWSVED